MKRSIQITIILVILFSVLGGNSIPSVHAGLSASPLNASGGSPWAMSMGGTGYDVGNSIATDSNGNSYTTGEFATTTFFSNGMSDIFVSKFDGNGTFLWTKKIGGLYADGGSAIELDSSNNVYVTGYYTGTVDFDPGIETFNIASSSDSMDIFLLKLDSNGNFIWAKSMGGTSDDQGMALTIDASGNIYVSSEFASIADFDPGVEISNLTSNGMVDIAIIKLDASGNFIWAKGFGGTNFDWSLGIKTGESGNVFITGIFSDIVDFDPGAGTTNLWTASSSGDIFLSVLDSDGQFLWAINIGGSGIDGGNDIVLDAANNIYVTGVFQDTVDFDPGESMYQLASAGGLDGFVLKLNSNGNFIWAYRMGGAGNDWLFKIRLDSSQNIYLAGSFVDTVEFGTNNLTSAGEFDGFVAKLDSQRELVWVKTMGGPLSDAAYGLALDSENSVITTGSYSGTMHFPGMGLTDFTSAGDTDIFVAKVSGDILQNLVVTKLADTNDGNCDSDCSMREAIAAASNGDLITFASYLSGETIHLASGLEVDKSITIDGSNLTPSIKISGDSDNDGDGDVLMMSVDANASLVINNIFFEFGKYNTYMSAGAINNYGNLTIHNSNFENNHGSIGGAIFNNANAATTIENSFFNYNEAHTDNGGEGAGGSIGNLGNLTVSSSQFSENSAMNGGGAIVNAQNGLTTISNSIFTLNSAGAEGGGAIYNIDNEIIISNSTFDSNTSTSDGGAIYNAIDGTTTLSNVTFIENSTPKNGGAIFSFSGSMNISNSTFSSNSAGLDGGGGIFNNTNSIATIINTVFNQNSAQGSFGAGGAIANIGSLTVNNSEFTQNTAIDGGGAIVNSIGGVASITNSTISDNTSTNGGGGIATADASTTTTLTNITLSNNSGGGLYIFDGIVHLKNSIFANSSGQPDCYNVSGSVSTNLNTLIENNATGINSCGTPLIASDPKLGPLANNGGFTQTMALLPGSPAIDAGDDTVCAADPVNNTSQNGLVRPQGSHCDIGAYEYPVHPPTFADVPANAFAWAQIEAIYNAGITGGCSTNPLNYCPNNFVTRAQMAIFLLRGIHGSSYSPPPATGNVFADVPSNAFAAAWIEQLVVEGITAGCGNGNYCPDNSVTRAQMAVFLLRAKYGAAYSPPAATGMVFTDVPSDAFAAAWIEQLVSEGVTAGCGGGNYCPNNAVTRAQMAVFLQRTFNLPLP